MTQNYKINNPLYKQNRRPRQLRGYLAFSGVDQLLARIAAPHLDEHARRLFSTQIPAEMRTEVQTLLFSDGTFTVYTGHAHWASWARNRARRLADSLRAGGVEACELRVVMCPAGRADTRAPVERPRKAPESAPQLLRQRAASTHGDDLKDALNRLANRIEKHGHDNP